MEQRDGQARRLEPLAGLPVKIQISLDRPDPEPNDEMRGPVNFAKVVTAIPELVARGIAGRHHDRGSGDLRPRRARAALPAAPLAWRQRRGPRCAPDRPTRARGIQRPGRRGGLRRPRAQGSSRLAGTPGLACRRREHPGCVRQTCSDGRASRPMGGAEPTTTPFGRVDSLSERQRWRRPPLLALKIGWNSRSRV